jgi:UTP--glucose-1-phosphate uridylyltransferase
MTKTQAFSITGLAGTQALAASLGVTRSAVSQWPDPLTYRQTNEVLGLAVRLGRLRVHAQDQPMVHEAIEPMQTEAAA